MVGIAAVSGNGQASLGDAFLGTGSVIQGSVHVGGRDVTRDGVESRLAAGLAIIPEDPLRDGAVPEMMVRENLNISSGPERSSSVRSPRPSVRRSHCPASPGAWAPCPAATSSAWCWPGS
jgi:ABC-type uncharacterized transport system ATPase subunit